MWFLLPPVRHRTLIFVGCAGAIGVVDPAMAATLEIPVLRDAVLYQDAAGNQASGAGDFLTAGRNNQGTNSIRRSLLQFDFSLLPTGAQVTSATLRLHLSTTVTTETVMLSVHRMTAQWGAGPGNPTGNEQNGVAPVTGDSTWLHAGFPSTLWATPGGDFIPSASALASVTNSSGFFTWSSPLIVDDVNAWLADPGKNSGWVLRSDESAPQTAKRFESGDSASMSFRPALVIDYNVVPEPGPWLTAAASCVTLLAGRRRRTRTPRSGRELTANERQ